MYFIYASFRKFVVCKIFLMLMLTKAALFYHKCSKSSNIMKYYYNFKITKKVIYSCDGKTEFSASLVFSVT